MTRWLSRFSKRLHHPLLLAAVAGACYSAPAVGPAPDQRAAADEFAKRAIATENVITADSIPQRTVGVAPLRVDQRDTVLGPLAYGLADLLMEDLSRSSQVQIVDRLRLDALLRELRLASTGRIDTATAPRVGRLVRARRIVLGSLTPLSGERVGIDVRIADVTTSQIRDALSASAPVNDILAAEKQLALRIFDQLGVNLTPAERVAVEQRQTQNLAALVAYGKGVRYEVEGDYGSAAREYREALRLDPAFALARQRFNSTQQQGPGVRTAQLERVTRSTTEHVNASFTTPIGTATDPAAQPQTIKVLISVTTP
jgi:TolB-like protein